MYDSDEDLKEGVNIYQKYLKIINVRRNALLFSKKDLCILGDETQSGTVFMCT